MLHGYIGEEEVIMSQPFKEIDDIVMLGKWAFHQIPDGERCEKCPILGSVSDFRGTTYFCNLCPPIALMHDEDGPFKGYRCPKKREK